MTLSGYIFTVIIRPRFSGPIGALAIVGLCWWAASAYRLVRQFDEGTPLAMTFPDAVTASKDGELYVRMTGATPDCSKVLSWNFGTAVALVESNGQIAAMAHLEECPKGKPESLQGVFLEPPFGLYGAAVAQGWHVTPGHLAFFEPNTRKSRAWTRIGIALCALPLVIGCVIAGVFAERRRAQRQTWRMRALGLGMMAGVSWFFYYAHDYVVFRLVPATVFGAVGFAVALAFVVFPATTYMKKVAQRVLPDE